MLFNLGLILRANIDCAGRVWGSSRLKEWADIIKQVVATGNFDNSRTNEWLGQSRGRLFEAVNVLDRCSK